ncbi:hypothetical protein Ddye_020257 [Dipteronia dyeriana]|uniref:Reverse transcriptase n=1 Tax=Dipteronia dyeriana TaxID=168575 RepID=A0AAD9WWI8_9ROSI|nr:hypothetical protein Ddye_020257 [Dipteronia dyeriana]
MGAKVAAAFLWVLNHGRGLKAINETLIVMIPKVKQVVRLLDFRPISMCNLVYKIVVKSLANRFLTVIGDVISETRSVFIPEGLSRLLMLAERRKELAGFRCSRGGPKITHLFFTDDSMLFTKASKRDCLTIKCVLDCYASASSQVVNFQKSMLFVSIRVSRQRGEALANVLGVHFIACHVRYIGLPSFVGQNKKEFFNSIRNRVWDCVKG